MKESIITYILARLTEGSTLRNLVLFICSMAGLTLSDQQTNSVVFLLLGIIGFLGATLPDNLSTLKKKSTDETTGSTDNNSTSRVQSTTNNVQTSGKLGRTSEQELSEIGIGYGDKTSN